MKKIEMVKCLVRPPRQSPDDAPGDPTARFVPYEIFRLWRYLMEQVKGFEIADVHTGYWFDEPMFSKEQERLAGRNAEPVVEVFFTYTKDTTVGRPVIRYFPKERFDAIMNVFLRNFDNRDIRGGRRLVNGFFVSMERQSD
ncbi:MAG: hypothetical protein M5R36_11085 [Deltaproteobacteria bacterium]|nr:hypothetical protein [Deltaproteobacteria bacterium]